MIEKEELLCAVWAHVITFLVYPNDEDFRFCQRCGYKPREALGSMLLPQKVPVDIGHIEKRKKDYLAAMRVEQLEARIVPTQADPIFISDLAAIAAFIGQQVNENVLSATQFFVLIRDQSLSSRETERVILERSRLRNCCTAMPNQFFKFFSSP